MSLIISKADLIDEYKIFPSRRNDIIGEVNFYFDSLDLKEFRSEHPFHGNLEILSKSSNDDFHTTQWYFDFDSPLFVPVGSSYERHLKIKLAELSLVKNDFGLPYFRFSIFEPPKDLKFDTCRLNEIAEGYVS